MTNNQLHVILATALDKVADNKNETNILLKRYGIAQALAVEEQLSDDDTNILSAATLLYDFNDGPGDAAEGLEGNMYQPIKVSNYIKQLLEETTVPPFEASAIASLVGLKEYGNDFDNPLHQLLLETDLLVRLTEENIDATVLEEATTKFKTAAGIRRYKAMTNENV